jgi:hypothetical protein
MPLFTKAGPLERGDRPPNRNGFWETFFRAFGRFRDWTWGVLIVRSSRYGPDVDLAVRAGDSGPEVKEPWHGLPNAELTEEQREDGARRLAEEEALRKARGD